MEIYEVLKQDHIKVKELLEELVTLKKDDDYHMIVVQQIADDLIPHVRAEEAVFYNAIRAMSSDSSDVMSAFKEHMEAESLLRMLQVKDRMDFEWKDTARRLQKALEKHIQEEETEIFSHARKMFSTEDATMMGAAFEKMKKEIAGKGFVKTSFEMVKNLMPPKFVEKMKNIGQ